MNRARSIWAQISSSTPVAYAFCINYILGVGVLGIPFAFSQGGSLLMFFSLLFVTLVAALTMSWLVDVGARCEAIVQLQEATGQAAQESVNVATAESTPLLDHPAPRFILSPTRIFENGELCGVFIGDWARHAYVLLVTTYMWGCFWSYAAVFGSSMATQFPFGDAHNCDPYLPSFDAECERVYTVYVVIFGVFVVTLSCLDLKEQVAIQIFMALYRFVALTTITITALIGMGTHPYGSGPSNRPGPYLGPDTSLVRWSGFGIVFATSVYAQVMHHSTPGLGGLVGNKKHVQRMFVAVFATTWLLYTMVGLSTSLYFGSNTEEVVSLHWAFYPWTSSKLSYSFISYLVILFPVFDVSSCYSLCAVTVGQNLFTDLPISWRQGKRRFWVKLATRIFASAPPVACAIFERHFAQIIHITGLIGFLLVFIVPSVLLYRSYRMCERLWGDEGKVTSHVGIKALTGPRSALVVGISGALALVFGILLVAKPDLLG